MNTGNLVYNESGGRGGKALEVFDSLTAVQQAAMQRVAADTAMHTLNSLELPPDTSNPVYQKIWVSTLVALLMSYQEGYDKSSESSRGDARNESPEKQWKRKAKEAFERAKRNSPPSAQCHPSTCCSDQCRRQLWRLQHYLHPPDPMRWSASIADGCKPRKGTVKHTVPHLCHHWTEGGYEWKIVKGWG